MIRFAPLFGAALLLACGISRTPAQPDLGADDGPTTRADTGLLPVDLGPDDGTDAGPPLAVRFTEVGALSGLTYAYSESGPCPISFLGECNPAESAGGAAIADVDGDGRPDVLLTSMDDQPRLYRNTEAGFVDVTADYPGIGQVRFPTNGAAFVDVDKDGDDDLYLTTLGFEDDIRFLLLIRDGDTFTEEGVARGAQVEPLRDSPVRGGFSVTVGDYDLDGWPDLHVNEYFVLSADWPPNTRLLRNAGAREPGHFTDVTVTAGVSTVDEACRRVDGAVCDTVAFGSALSDLDNDGFPDLIVIRDFGRSLLFWGRGDGTFVESTEAAGVALATSEMGSTLGDIDGDGDLDWFATAIGQPFPVPDCGGEPCDDGLGSGNRLYRNEGDRTFADITEEAGVLNGGYGWGTALFDHDNDGDLDLVMTNGSYSERYLEDHARFWENDGTGSFTERSAETGLDYPDAGRGLLVWDYDLDGDEDLLVIVNSGRGPLLLRNDGGNEAGSWIRVRAVGTTSVTDGTGARVFVRANRDRPMQMREIGTTTQFLGQSERVAHFGLGPGVDEVSFLQVRFPSGQVVRLRDVEARQTIEVVEPEL